MLDVRGGCALANVCRILSPRSLISGARPISNVAVIGCGLMGSGITAVSAGAGYSVKLLGLNYIHLKKAEERILKILHRLLRHKSGGFVASVMSKIEFTTDANYAVSGCGMIIESVTEDLEIKRQLFQSMERLTPSSCIFASNTSGLLIKEIAEGLSRKEHLGGMHFFSPVEVMKLVEITRSEYTSDNTIEALTAFAESLGKTVIQCKDTPGFIVNRLLVPYLLEAVEMWERREASLDEIDAAMRIGAGHPMGPFELADHVGLDTLLRIVTHWVEHYPEERAFRLNATVHQLVACGRFGKKSGRGFFKYDQNGRISKE